MGLLNRFFHSPERRAQDIAADEAELLHMWSNYMASTKKKGDLIAALTPGETLKSVLEQLNSVLASAIVETAAEQKTEEHLLKELRAIKHEEHVKRVKQLDYILGYEETRYKYMYRLLQEMCQILNRQLHLVEKLIKGSTEENLLIQRLKESWELETYILTQISEWGTFKHLFVGLMKNRYIVRQLTPSEKKLVLREEKETGITKRLMNQGIDKIMARLNAKVQEEHDNGRLIDHADADFQFVNSAAFVDFAREILQSLRPTKPISVSTLNAFVHIFRERFNRMAPQ